MEPVASSETPTEDSGADSHFESRTGNRQFRWAIVLAVCAAIWFIPPPSGITPKSWHLLAIFVATITGSIVRPLPGGAMVLLGVAALVTARLVKRRNAHRG